MLGRGIDQILQFPSKPVLHESFVKDARDYIHLAEAIHGKLSYPVTASYIWGDSLFFLEQFSPDVRIINLETAVTQRGVFWPNKEVHYRMNPKNLSVLETLKPVCCHLANNHILDFGWAGLEECLRSLEKRNLSVVGAGRNEEEAKKPLAIQMNGKKRILIWGVGCQDSGIPSEWAAHGNKKGVHWIPNTSREVAQELIKVIQLHKRNEDLAVVSIHWGGNWGFKVSEVHREFARTLVDEGEVSLIYGHSSHHVKGFEIYKGKLILYGCGDFMTDYEGIKGHESYRGNLSLMYFPKLDLAGGRLIGLTLVPLSLEKFRLKRANLEEQSWLKKTLLRECLELSPDFEKKSLIKWVGTPGTFR